MHGQAGAEPRFAYQQPGAGVFSAKTLMLFSFNERGRERKMMVPANGSFSVSPSLVLKDNVGIRSPSWEGGERKRTFRWSTGPDHCLRHVLCESGHPQHLAWVSASYAARRALWWGFLKGAALSSPHLCLSVKVLAHIQMRSVCPAPRQGSPLPLVMVVTRALKSSGCGLSSWLHF